MFLGKSKLFSIQGKGKITVNTRLTPTRFHRPVLLPHVYRKLCNIGKREIKQCLGYLGYHNSLPFMYCSWTFVELNTSFPTFLPCALSDWLYFMAHVTYTNVWHEGNKCLEISEGSLVKSGPSFFLQTTPISSLRWSCVGSESWFCLRV